MSNNGKQGERLCKQLLENWGYSVQDVSLNPQYYFKGDLLATSPATGATKIFEVKWDTRIHKTNNLYLELSNANSKAKDGLGWFKWCEADFLAYGDAITKQFYIIDLKALKQRAKEVPYITRACGCDSVGQIISLKQIDDLILNK